MTHRCWAALLMVTTLGVCSQAFSQNLVSPKLLPPAATLRAGIAARNLAFDAGDDSPNQAAAPHRHWSKTGKVLTFVGIGLVGAGAAALVHGQDTRIACTSNGTTETCADIKWRATGASLAGCRVPPW